MKNFAKLMSTMGGLLLLTSFIVLYSDGWRLNALSKQDQDKPNTVVVKTGMLAIRSIPEGAKVYIDNEARTATDDTIASLNPGKYKLKVIKEGFETWEKDVEVFPELVTDITAMLVSKSPRLEPLTTNDVKAYALSSNLNNIAFLSSNNEKPGIWILPIGGNPLNIFTNTTRILIPDTKTASPSKGEKIWWSPDDKEILVQMNPTGYLLYNITGFDTANSVPTPITNVESVFERWDESWKKDFLLPKVEQITSDSEIKPDDWIIDSANNKKTTWSPDDKKFFFYQPNAKDPNTFDIIVYDSENPLPIGENRINYPMQGINTENTKVYWYSDSYHLITVEKNPNSENFYTINLVRIDGTIKTPIYSGTLSEPTAIPTPGGERIIVLTSIKDNSPTNLYGIALR